MKRILNRILAWWRNLWQPPEPISLFCAMCGHIVVMEGGITADGYAMCDSCIFAELQFMQNGYPGGGAVNVIERNGDSR